MSALRLGRAARATAAAALAAATVGIEVAGAANPCDGVGWQEITAGGWSIRHVSSLSGAEGYARVYAGSRQGTNNVMLYSGAPSTTDWQAESNLTGLPVTDVLVTPGRSTEVWVSTFGDQPTYDGPVLGRAADQPFSPRGGLRSWFMSLAATSADTFVAASKPNDRGVYRWDEGVGQWQRMGGQTIETVVFHALEAGGDGALWLGTDRQGLWRSADDGASWQPIGDPSLNVWSVAVAPDRPEVLLIGLGPPDSGGGSYVRGLSLSPDGGQRWFNATEPHLSQADIVPAIAFSHRFPSRAFSTGYGVGLFQSADFGASWSPYPVPASEQRFFEALLVVPVSESCELLLAGGQTGLYARNLFDAPATIYVPFTARRASPGG